MSDILNFTDYESQKKKLEVLDFNELEKNKKKELIQSGETYNDEVENERGFVDNFVEGSKGVAQGFVKGVEGTAEFVNMVINPWIGLGEATWKYTATGEWDKDLIQKEYFSEKIDIVPDFLEVEEGSVAAFNSDVVAFFSNYGMIKKGIQQIPLLAKDPTKPYRLGKELVIGALTDVTAFDPEDGTAVDFLLDRYPGLSNPVFEFLTTDENDSDAMIKLKQALEGAGITGGIHIVAKGLGLFKQYNQGVVARYKGKKLEQAKIIEEANNKGIIVDDAADAAAKIKESEFIGPKQVKPKPVPKQKEVLLDEKQLDESIRNTNDIVNVDLPFNVKNWKSSLDVQVVIEKTVKAMNKSYKDKWDNVLTNKQVDEVSDMMDMEADVLVKGLSSVDNVAELPFRVIATKKALQGLGVEAKRLSKIIAKGGSDVSTKTDLAKTLAIIAKTTDELKDAIKAAARTTQAGRIKTGAAKIDIQAIADITKNFDGNIEEFAKRISKIEDFAGLKKSIERSFAQKSWDVITEVYINALLSGPLTQVINLSSTFIETFLRPLELLTGGALTIYTKNGRRSVKLAFSRYRGLMRGIDDTLVSVGRAFKEEDLYADKMGRIIENKAPKAFSSQNFNIKNKTGAAIFDFVGGAFRLPSRLLVTTDELFKQINYRAKLHEMAVNGALNKNLKGANFDSYVRKFEKKGFDKLGRFVNDEARMYSREATFTQELSGGAWLDLGSRFQALSKGSYNPFRLMLPFVRTPTNLFRHQMQRMPITGLLQKRNFDMLRKGGVQRSEVIGRQVLGSMVMYKAYDLAINEQITGRGPKNPALREAWLLTHKPYSKKVIKDDGTVEWVAYNRMDPRFMFVGIIADLVQFFDEANPERDRNIMAGVMVSLISNMTSKTYLSGVTDLMTAIGTESPTRWNRFLQNSALSFIPYSSFMRQTNNDAAMREVRTLADSYDNLTWGDAENVAPKRNILGEVVIKPKGVFGFPVKDWLLPIVGKTSTTESTPLKEALSALAATSTTDPGKGIVKQNKRLPNTNIDLTDPKYAMDGMLPLDSMLARLNTYKITDPADPDYGKTVKEALTDLVTKSPEYKEALGPAQSGFLNDKRAKMIQSVYNKYKTKIRMEVIRNNPKLQKDYINALEEKRGAFKNVDSLDRSSKTLDQLINF